MKGSLFRGILTYSSWWSNIDLSFKTGWNWKCLAWLTETFTEQRSIWRIQQGESQASRAFRQRKQATGETAQQFLATSRTMAGMCNFANNDRELRDQLVLGCLDEDSLAELDRTIRPLLIKIYQLRSADSKNPPTVKCLIQKTANCSVNT